MNIRKIRKRNKKRIEEILRKLKYRPINLKFDRGAYLPYNWDYSGSCIFKLKELPKWLFSIWLTEDGYYIFGQMILFIDKFKPTRSDTVCAQELSKFHEQIDELIKDNGWCEECTQKLFEEETEYLKEIHAVQLKHYAEILRYLNQIHDSDPDKMLIALDDSRHRLPRYIIDLVITKFHTEEYWLGVKNDLAAISKKYDDITIGYLDRYQVDIIPLEDLTYCASYKKEHYE